MKTLFRRWLALSGLVVLACSAQEQDYTYWVDHGTITITEYRGPGGDVNIPNEIKGFPVTRIGERAFSGCTTLTSVTLPNSVTIVEREAFSACTRLTNIAVDPTNPSFSSVDGVLFDKSQNTLIQYPGGKAGNYAVPDGVTRIGGWAFSGCTSLVNINLPEGVTELGGRAFQGCVSLTSVDIPNSLTNICYDIVFPFSGCTGLSAINTSPEHPTYSSREGVLFNKDQSTLLICPGGKAGQYTVPNSVKTILSGAFCGCSSITRITVPASVIAIANWIDAPGYFWYGLETTFGGCSSLSAIEVDPANPTYASLGGVLFDKSQTQVLQYPPGRAGSYAVPEGVTRIGCLESEWFFGWGGAFPFAGCKNLTDVSIPATVTNIEDWAFESCSSLTGLVIPESVTTIGSFAFYGCTGLTKITIPDNVTGLGGAAFYACAGLTNVSIGDGVTVLHAYHVWSGPYCGTFGSCTSLTSVTLGHRVTKIAGSAFYRCTSLANIIIPENVTSIGQGAFEYCSSLTTITIGPSVTNIEFNGFHSSSPFYGCASLTAIQVDPQNPVYSSVDGVVFSKDRSSLLQFPMGKSDSYVIPTGVTEFNGLAFIGCTGLTNITVPDTVTNLGSTFYGCANLTSVRFEGNAPAFVDGSPFFQAPNVTVFYLPGSEGWGSTFAGRPTALWLPLLVAGDSSFGVPTNQFGFNINWARDKTVVVEAATNLANPVWLPLSTNTLVDGTSYFSDAESTNYAARFYRVRSQ